MIIQYIKSAWRNLLRNKLSTFLNVVGLSIGLGTGILAMLYAYSEISYEKCHTKADRLAKVITYGDFGAFKQLPTTFPQTAIDLPEKFPQIERAVRIRKMNGATVFKSSIPLLQNNMITAEAGYLDMFTYKFKQGRYTGQNNTIIISEKMSHKYFGDADPLGETLKIEIYGNIFHLTVEAVYHNLPYNTHLKTSAIISWNVAQKLYQSRRGFESTNFDVYCLVNPHTDIKQLNQQIATDYNIPVNIEGCKVALMPVKDFHLKSTFENNTANLYLLFIGGIISLIISILNYVNQSTILYSMRIQEVGIRLSNGGKSKDIFIQFMLDTFLVTLVSFSLSLFILFLVLPHFNNLMDTEISLQLGIETTFIIIALFAFTALLAGFYPSLVMSKTKPALLIRSVTGQKISKSRMRSIMTTVQFVFAILLLQVMMVIQRQGSVLENANHTGFDEKNVIAINGYKWGNLNKLKEELLRNTAIEAVSWGQNLPGMQTNMTPDWLKEGNNIVANKNSCEAGYFDLFKIKMKKGSSFSGNNKADKDKVIINELLVKTLGWEDAIGKQIMLHKKQYQVIGVVDNYMAAPPIFNDTPLILLSSKNQDNNLLIRVNPNRRKEAHKHITFVLRQANPNYPINLKYYEELAYDLAKSFISTATLINAFVIIIILNALLSLFGLSHFIAERNKKQIGIKKVFGASGINVYWELSKSFVWRFAIAFTIITPLSYFFSKQYISTFSRQLPLTSDIFILSGALVLGMLLISTSYKIIRTVLRNPVDAIRYE